MFFQFLVVKHNEHQIEEIKQLAKEIGVDQVRFKTAQVYDYENDPNHLIPAVSAASRRSATLSMRLPRITESPITKTK